MAETRVQIGGGGYIVKTNGTGAAAMSVSFTAVRACKLGTVTCKFSAAPTTSENFTVSLDANAGAAYDVTWFTYDPGAVGSITFISVDETDIGEVWLVPGDIVTVAYTNTDTRTYGVEITVKEYG